MAPPLRLALAGLLAAGLLGGGALAAQPSPNEQRRLERELESALVHVLGEDARSIRVALVDDGRRAILSGEVRERTTREIAGEVVLAAHEIRRISNRVKATRSPSILEGKLYLEGRDAELEIRVKLALLREGRPLARALEVEAVEGTISLRGAVLDRDERERALRAAAGVPGVTRLVDLVQVDPASVRARRILEAR
jgi:osmotically-inducible protein OsmY